MQWVLLLETIEGAGGIQFFVLVFLLPFLKLLFHIFDRLFIPGQLILEPSPYAINGIVAHFQIGGNRGWRLAAKQSTGDQDPPPEHDPLAGSKKVAKEQCDRFTTMNGARRSIKSVKSLHTKIIIQITRFYFHNRRVIYDIS